MSAMRSSSKLLLFLYLSLWLFTCSQAATSWCVLKKNPPVSNEKVQAFIDFACGEIDCSPIRPGGTCYEPNTYDVHGTYALDAIYRVNGDCNEIGFITTVDPSFGTCRIP
ncbi:OLC1v1025229C1 [Oldenlandia corymbosa var. corymbosa]|uniref:OLC1v1025229C1 n=1 Tax=Oldenlandia corymbosa var. corymbosa TaxID=529605 RepID=A0AAV1C7L2_OLDCO|nr:OLC1v1025229C1 [Oldenlandia corymbosa var. corymbosa]